MAVELYGQARCVVILMRSQGVGVYADLCGQSFCSHFM